MQLPNFSWERKASFALNRIIASHDFFFFLVSNCFANASATATRNPGNKKGTLTSNWLRKLLGIRRSYISFCKTKLPITIFAQKGGFLNLRTCWSLKPWEALRQQWVCMSCSYWSFVMFWWHKNGFMLACELTGENLFSKACFYTWA